MMMMTDVRIMGTREECIEFVNEIKLLAKIDGYTVKSISQFYPNRGTSIEGRVYIKI